MSDYETKAGRQYIFRRAFDGLGHDQLISLSDWVENDMPLFFGPGSTAYYFSESGDP